MTTLENLKTTKMFIFIFKKLVFALLFNPSPQLATGYRFYS